MTALVLEHLKLAILYLLIAAIIGFSHLNSENLAEPGHDKHLCFAPRVPLARFPSPLVGEGARAKRGRVRGQWFSEAFIPRERSERGESFPRATSPRISLRLSGLRLR